MRKYKTFLFKNPSTTLNIKQLNFKLLMIPGEYITAKGNIKINAGRKAVIITVVNTGDRPVQVGSHFHFFEVNRQMNFDRAKAFGMRLDIAAGTAVRFEPGEETEVELTEFGGKKKITGFNNLVDGKISKEAKTKAVKKAYQKKFKNSNDE